MSLFSGDRCIIPCTSALPFFRVRSLIYSSPVTDLFYLHLVSTRTSELSFCSICNSSAVASRPLRPLVPLYVHHVPPPRHRLGSSHGFSPNLFSALSSAPMALLRFVASLFMPPAVFSACLTALILLHAPASATEGPSGCAAFDCAMARQVRQESTRFKKNESCWLSLLASRPTAFFIYFSFN